MPDLSAVEASPSDVVLVYPKTGQDFGSTVSPPHSLLAVAAPFHHKGYRVKIIDQRRDPFWKKTLAGELAGRPICVGLTSMVGTQLHFAIETAKIVRQKTDGAVPIVWGGPHATTLPEQTLASPWADVVCIGEGEITFLELVETLSSHRPLSGVRGIAFRNGGEVVKTRPRELMEVESLLPIPWELVDVEEYIQPDYYLKDSPRTMDIGQTSRGCPYRCGFCSSSAIRGNRWRPMSAEESLEAIVKAVRAFRLDGIWIRDDAFYVDRKRAAAICEGLIKENLNLEWYSSGMRIDIFNKASAEELDLLKRSGARVLKFGAESGSNRILKLMNKGFTKEETLFCNLKAKKHGLVPSFAMMIGFPTETFADIEQTLDLCLRLKRDNPRAHHENMHTYTPLPGTPLYSLALEHGLNPPETLEGWTDWEFVEYDLKGRKLPWFDLKERKKIGHINYIYTIAYAIPNLIGSLRSRFLRLAVRVLSLPMIGLCRLRAKKKWYNRAPELLFLKFLREKILYKSTQFRFR
jgi:anaerobic magnesium-protoporphyrin IX monomethyl ester cyclase